MADEPDFWIDHENGLVQLWDEIDHIEPCHCGRPSCLYVCIELVTGEAVMFNAEDGVLIPLGTIH